jgi:hypothetical protein
MGGWGTGIEAKNDSIKSVGLFQYTVQCTVSVLYSQNDADLRWSELAALDES